MQTREQGFAKLFYGAYGVRLYKRGPFFPPKTLVALELLEEEDSGEAKLIVANFIRGDSFFKFLLVSGHISVKELKIFFPNAGKKFDVLNESLSHLQSKQQVREGKSRISVPVEVEGWPCFDLAFEQVTKFVRIYLGKRFTIYERYGRGILRQKKEKQLGRKAQAICIFFPNGDIQQERNGSFGLRIGLGR